MRTVPDRGAGELDGNGASEPRRRRPLGVRARLAWSSTAPPPRRSLTAHASLLAGSAVIALGVSDALNHWFLGGRDLRASTDVVGYPTYANFNSEHYIELFILAAVVFPLVLGVSFVAFELVVPRLLARYSPRGVVEASGVVGRLAVPGLAFGMVTAVGLQSSGRAAGLTVAAVAAAYGAGLAVVSMVVAALWKDQPALRVMAALNAATANSAGARRAARRR